MNPPWWHGLVVARWSDQLSYSMLGPFSTGMMGDRLQAGEPPQFVTTTQANSAFYPRRDGK